MAQRDDVKEIRFVPGKIYDRKEIHAKLGGQRQGGISTPKDKPVILLFTGEQGRHYGYEDGWQGEMFFYTGEGRFGDMQFVRGNRAVRDHLKEGKTLLLFQYISKGKVRFLGEMVCIGYDWIQAPDMAGRIRQAIRFK